MFEPEQIFQSSGTTSDKSSHHYIKSLDLYRKSFKQAFNLFYGDPASYCILGLLPSYLERNNSSLVLMVDELIRESNHALSGFYLDDHEKLYQTILHNEIRQQKTLLFGVTFALLDFAKRFRSRLSYTAIIETGGMKGRKKEITRAEVHEILKKSFGENDIHSEYSMTELLSQAYSKKDGLFTAPPWMRVLVREDDDPLTIQPSTVKRSKTGKRPDQYH